MSANGVISPPLWYASRMGQPRIPELPPGYDVYRRDTYDDWIIYAHDEYCDGIDPLPTRSAAVTEAWRMFYEYDAGAEWIAFLKALGAP